MWAELKGLEKEITNFPQIFYPFWIQALLNIKPIQFFFQIFLTKYLRDRWKLQRLLIFLTYFLLIYSTFFFKPSTRRQICFSNLSHYPNSTIIFSFQWTPKKHHHIDFTNVKFTMRTRWKKFFFLIMFLFLYFLSFSQMRH